MDSLARMQEAMFNEYPIVDVLLDLGIIPKGLDEGLVGVLEEPVLDIGCGRNAHLVHHLRDSGLNAEGIDPELLEELAGEPYLMRAEAENIPRPDSHYGSAVTHMSFFQLGMIFPALVELQTNPKATEEGLLETYRREMKPYLMKALGEITRVLKPNAVLTIQPCPSQFLKDGLEELRDHGYRFRVADVVSTRQKAPDHLKAIAFEYSKRLQIRMPEK